MLAEGVGGCPLGGPGGRFAGGRWLAELLDLVAKLGLAVDPGPGDVGGSGETAEGSASRVRAWRAWVARARVVS